MLLPGCRCCDSCGECTQHTYQTLGTRLPVGFCKNELIHTEIVTIPEKFSLPCRVRVTGPLVDDDLEVNGTRVRQQLTTYSTPCAVRPEHIEPVTDQPTRFCPSPSMPYYCFLSYERTLTISVFDNFGGLARYALDICYGGTCVEQPPLGACCEYHCDGCTIEARPQVSQTETNCLALGYGSDEFPPLKISRTAIFTEMTDDLPIQWAAGYPAALAVMGITRYWIVLDSSESPWCTMCGGELNTDSARKYRWRLLYVDCVSVHPPMLKQSGDGFEPFAGKTWWDGSTYPVSSDGTWEDTAEKEISACRPEATSIDFLPFRSNPSMTCVPKSCLQTFRDQCVVDGSVNPSWYEGAPCEACRTVTDNPLP